jgi:hypothetical protein
LLVMSINQHRYWQVIEQTWSQKNIMFRSFLFI